jgi:hypothetical protein
MESQQLLTQLVSGGVLHPCNAVLGMSGGATTASTATPDEVEVVLSGDPGATGATIVMKFIGVASSSDAS